MVTHQQVLTVVLLSLVYGAITSQQSVVFGVCLDIGGRYAGATVGLMNTSSQVGGLLSSVAYGYIVRCLWPPLPHLAWHAPRSVHAMAICQREPRRGEPDWCPAADTLDGRAFGGLPLRMTLYIARARQADQGRR